MLDLVCEQLGDGHTAAAREAAYFARAKRDDDERRDAAAEDGKRRAQARVRQAEATPSDLGLGHDSRTGLIEPGMRNYTRSRRSSATCSPATTAS